MTDGITITRMFDAPRELVFDAWTRPEHFIHWFGGHGTTVPLESVEMDVRPGGAWKATMVLSEQDSRIDWIGHYLEVDPPERVVLTLNDVPEDGDDDGETVTVLLTEVDGGTEMVFHQGGGTLSPEEYEQARAGWLQFFERLESRLASIG